MGDLQGEFSSAPDKGEELPLEVLGAALGSGHSGNLGKYPASPVSQGHWWQDARWLQYFKYESSSLQDMGSSRLGPQRADYAAYCYYLWAGGGDFAGGSFGGAVMNSKELLKFQAK